MITTRIDKATGEFLQDGPAADGVTVIEIPVIRNPDPRKEKYSGNPAAPFQTKTAPEVTAYDAAVTAKAIAAKVSEPLLVAVRDLLVAAKLLTKKEADDVIAAAVTK